MYFRVTKIEMSGIYSHAMMPSFLSGDTINEQSFYERMNPILVYINEVGRVDSKRIESPV